MHSAGKKKANNNRKDSSKFGEKYTTILERESTGRERRTT